MTPVDAIWLHVFSEDVAVARHFVATRPPPSLPPCRNAHIKTHLWDLSTNLSKLNIFLKLKKILYYMKVKYMTTTNKHFFDVSLPLDDEMKLKAWHYQH